MDAGIYDDLSGAEYFAATDWVSSSKLKHHLPEWFKPFTGTSDAREFGVAFHSLILGAGDPIQPVNASNWRTKDAQEKRIAAREAGMVPVLEADMPRFQAMCDSVRSHPEAAELLLSKGRPEVSVFADTDGVPCKARFDYLTAGVAVDVKTTTAMPSEHDLTRAILNYGYDVQADHYLRVASAAGLDVEAFVFIFCGKEPPHHVSVVELDESFYERAAVLRGLALDRINHPEMVEPYPGASNRLTVSVPRWAQL